MTTRTPSLGAASKCEPCSTDRTSTSRAAAMAALGRMPWCMAERISLTSKLQAQRSTSSRASFARGGGQQGQPWRGAPSARAARAVRQRSTLH
eukprot:scaffold58177_cov19-Tisochrysis_lutea.AAC.1